jgi:hypothetical protein
MSMAFGGRPIDPRGLTRLCVRRGEREREARIRRVRGGARVWRSCDPVEDAGSEAVRSCVPFQMDVVLSWMKRMLGG